MSFLNRLLGGYSPLDFAAFTFWACIGAFILMQIHANTRDAKSFRTPVNFSWRFWLLDNVRRITWNLLLILTAIRFSKDLTGREITDFWALVIGLSSDGLAMALQGLNIFKFTGTAKKTPPEPIIEPDYPSPETSTNGREKGAGPL
jgi:hypothetical protein